MRNASTDIARILLAFAAAAIPQSYAGSTAPVSACLTAKAEDLLGATPYEEWVLAQNDGSLFQLRATTPVEAGMLNTWTLDALKAQPIPARLNPSRKATLNAAERQALYDDVVSDPRSKSICSGQYRGSENLGFCFGRAIIAHLKAIQTRLSTNSVRKLWVVGPLQSGDTKWVYHVTTIVRGDDGEWYAIDPLRQIGGPVTAAEWLRKFKAMFDLTGTARIISTRASRASPDAARKVSTKSLAYAGFRGFFIDFFDDFTRENGAGTTTWRRLKSRQEKLEFLEKHGRTLGISGLSAAGVLALGGIIYELSKPDPAPDSTRGRPGH